MILVAQMIFVVSELMDKKGGNFMIEVEVFNPTGAIEIEKLHARRLKDFKGKKIGFVSNDEWQAHRTLPLVEKLLSAQCKEVETAPIEAFPIGNDLIDTEELVQVVQSKDVDAIIIGNAA